MHPGTVTLEIAADLLALLQPIEVAGIPPSKLDETISIAVRNIREFGDVRRTDAVIHYVPEIAGQFAIVELRDNLADIGHVLCYLGHSCRVVYSDWINGPGSNHERNAFLYNHSAVTFNRFSAELDVCCVKDGQEYLAKTSFYALSQVASGNADVCATSLPSERTGVSRSRQRKTISPASACPRLAWD